MREKKIERFFPTPSFLKIPSVGFDISDRSIKYCFFEDIQGELVLAGYERIPLPLGLVTSGKITDPVGLKKILNEIASKLKRHHVRVSLPEEQVYLFSVKLPILKSDEVRGGIALSLEEHVPISSAEALFDYDLVKKTKSDLIMQVAATSQEIVDSYMEVFEGTPFVPLSFELEAQALARAIIARNDPGTHMIVDFGETRTGISIVSGGYVLFTSTIDVGGHNLNDAIAKHFNITIDEAKAKKEMYGLEGGGRDESNIMPAVVGSLSALQDEINKHYIFWHNHPYDDGSERPKIDGIYLCGGEANIKGVDNYLTQTLRTKVQKANPWVNISDFTHIIPDLPYKDSLAYATAFGLALGDTMYD